MLNKECLKYNIKFQKNYPDKRATPENKINSKLNPLAVDQNEVSNKEWES